MEENPQPELSGDVAAQPNAPASTTNDANATGGEQTASDTHADAGQANRQDISGDHRSPTRHRGRGGRAGRNGGFSRGGHSLKTDRREVHESNRQRRDSRRTARATDHDGERKQSNMMIPFSAEEIAAEDRRPKRKVAVLIGYSGTGYKGMQMNHYEKTIEGDLFAAFVAAGAIAKRNADDPKKSSFVRCARTDKGVHAAGNVISLKLTIDDARLVEKINEKLPEQIRVWGIQRTNNAFNCYQACDSRWYEYLMPSYSLLPPHPQSFLGKNVIGAAKEKGLYEDRMKAWADVEDFWDEVETNSIQPILDRLDQQTREQALQLMHASYEEDGPPLAEGQDPTQAGETCQLSSTKRKAERDGLGPSKKPKTAEESDVEEASLAGTIRPIEGEQSMDTTSLGDAVDQQEATAKKCRHQPSTIELALREIKVAYVAAKRRYRVSADRIQQLQEALDMYEGTKNFHNYTIQKSFKDPSAKRHIRSFKVCPQPIQIRDTEWLSLKVHGQSFMMHQIRKMVAMAVLCVRCAAPLDLITESYGPKRISLPKAPGLGLLLERPVFESYSKKAVTSFARESLDFKKYEKDINEFKHKHIYSRIWDTEEKENSFHTFFHQLDNFESDHFLWLTAHGIEAAYEPKERRDPKAFPRALLNALQEDDGDEDPDGSED